LARPLLAVLAELAELAVVLPRMTWKLAELAVVLPKISMMRDVG
jgi:hypothetical protein